MAGLGQRILGGALAGAGTGIIEQAKQRRQDTLLALQRKFQVEDRDHAAALTREGRAQSAAMTREGWDRADTRAATAADMTREGWDRADARAERTISATDARDLVPVWDEDLGVNVFQRKSQAEGSQPARGAKKSGPPVKARIDGKTVWVDPQAAVSMGLEVGGDPKLIPTKEDPVTGEIIHKTTDQIMAGNAAAADEAQRGEATAEAAEATEDMDSMWSSDQKIYGEAKAEHQRKLTQAILANPGADPQQLQRQIIAEAKATGGQKKGGSAVDATASEASPPAGYPDAQKGADGNWYVKKGKDWFRVD